MDAAHCARVTLSIRNDNREPCRQIASHSPRRRLSFRACRCATRLHPTPGYSRSSVVKRRCDRVGGMVRRDHRRRCGSAAEPRHFIPPIGDWGSRQCDLRVSRIVAGRDRVAPCFRGAVASSPGRRRRETAAQSRKRPLLSARLRHRRSVDALQIRTHPTRSRLIERHHSISQSSSPGVKVARAAIHRPNLFDSTRVVR